MEKVKRLKKHSFIKGFIIFAGSLLVLAGLLVYIFDPFYHYHAPYFNMKPVLTMPEYQVMGTIKNFPHDSSIVGSSMAENFDNKDFDNAFGCTSIKLIKTSGTTGQLLYYLKEDLKRNEIKNIFYSLDVSALEAEYKEDFPDSSMPLYLYDDNPFNDVQYLFNKDVICKYIPYMLALSGDPSYNAGKSYSFDSDKSFSAYDAILHYERPAEVLDSVPESEYKPIVDSNISALKEVVEANPDTTFYFYIPTYSCLWWDNAYRMGQIDETYYAIEESAKELTACDNVEFYCFIDEEEISDNLNLYMDAVHFSPEINNWIVGQLSSHNKAYILNSDNIESRIEEIKSYGSHEIEYSSSILDN